MRFTVMPAIAIAALAAGCGSTSPVSEPLPSVTVVETVVETAVETAPTTAEVATTAVQEPTTPTTAVASDPESFAVVELQSMKFDDLSLCERVISISFFVDEWYSYEWHEDGQLVVEGDDFIDTTDGRCAEGVIDAVEDDPRGNYPTIEIAEVDGTVTAHELTDDGALPIDVTDIELRGAELTLQSFGPDLDAARDMALTHIKSLLDADAATFEATLHDDVMWFEDNELTTPEEIMGYAAEQGFPWGQDVASISIEDYLRDFDPSVSWLDDTEQSDETRQVLADIAGTTDVAIYRASGRHGRPKVQLGTDLGRYALAMTNAGWRVIAL